MKWRISARSVKIQSAIIAYKPTYSVGVESYMSILCNLYLGWNDTDSSISLRICQPLVFIIVGTIIEDYIKHN